jgi:hypothetical protein
MALSRLLFLPGGEGIGLPMAEIGRALGVGDLHHLSGNIHRRRINAGMICCTLCSKLPKYPLNVHRFEQQELIRHLQTKR